MDIFGDYINIAFPYKLINCSKTYNSKWITKGIINISSKRMHFLNSVKRKFSLSRKYHTIPHTKSTEGSQIKEIMIGILKRQQIKQNKIWQLINKQAGQCSSLDKKN